MTMADVVAVMNSGRIEQMGSPRELYELPKTAFVANFLGKSNLMPGKVVADAGPAVVVEVAGQRVELLKERAVSITGDIVVGVRPEKMRIAEIDSREFAHAGNQLTGVVTDASFTGVSTEYLVEVPGVGSVATSTQNLGQDPARPGDAVRMSWDPEYTFGLGNEENLNAGVIEE